MKTRIPSPNTVSGSTLIALVSVFAVVALMLVAYLSLMRSQVTATGRSQSWQLCMPAAEAGIEEAMAHLNYTKGVGLGSNGWTASGGNYIKQVSLAEGYYYAVISNSNPYSVLSTGYVRGYPTSNFIKRAIFVTTQATNATGKPGMISKGKITMQGNAKIDSYDSSNPLYSSNGVYVASKKRDKGYLASNSRTANDVLIKENTEVAGNFGSGSVNILKIESPAAVGDSNFVWGGSSSGVQAGHHETGLNLSFSFEPTFAGGAAVPGVIDNSTYNLTGGDYKINNLTIKGASGKLNVTATSRLLVTDDFYIQDAAKITIASGAELKLIVGKQIYFQGDAQANWGGKPEQFKVYGLSTSVQSYIQGNAKVASVLDAPNSKLDMSGNAELSGSAVAGELVLQGDFKFHLDEALANGSPGGGVISIVSWQEL
jgi:hypothetical protein